MPVVSGIGPQAGASSIIGSDTLPSTPTFRQCYVTPSGMYVCLSDGTWSLLDSADAGTVSGSGVTNRLTRWIDGTGSVLGDSGVADDGTNVLSLRPFAVGYGLSTPASLLAGPRISAASTISTSPRGILSAQFTTDTAGARVGLQKARGTIGTPTTVVSGDTLGRLMFRGYDGTGYLEMGSIEVASTGTIATSRIPTTIVLSTATDANPSVLTAAVTIGANQGVTCAATLTVSGAITYGGVTLSNAVTGTGAMVLDTTPSFTTSIKTPAITAPADSTTAFQYFKANGSTALLTYDTTNLRVGLNRTPSAVLDIAAAGTAVTLRAAGPANNWTMIANGDSTSGQSFGIQANAGTTSADASAVFNTQAGTQVAKMRGDRTIELNTNTYNSCTALTTTAGVLGCTASDESVKEGITQFESGLDIIRMIEPILFRFKKGTSYFDGKTRLGLSAQNLQKASPFLVSSMGNDIDLLQPEPLAIKGAIINAIKELADMVGILDVRINKLAKL